ncbi:MAG: hypothetical protein QS2022_0540 [Candidatus Phytoplasma asteris]|uniref:hypothetical protein n=1 Tax='Chrysanthemum coronarium' phytoplasma TaxID=1520703 RepID=UPI00030B6FE9|nr:hypothetical protein ['Chrysanthemum coronarium' phytoplasma]TKA88245.1 MAG: hypothetical protein PLY_0540 [Periwinkle leaf yellowing phytoplasma]WEX19344.1 MAG: hypothetical protein QS2022_0540 [Candidatus Phytoplasma asteris]
MECKKTKKEEQKILTQCFLKETQKAKPEVEQDKAKIQKLQEQLNKLTAMQYTYDTCKKQNIELKHPSISVQNLNDAFTEYFDNDLPLY